MAEGMISMSRRERERMEAAGAVKRGEITLADAAARLGVGYRQAKRIWKRFKESGASGLTHGGRGRAGTTSKDAAVRREALALVEKHYADCGPTYASERLASHHGIKVDHETLRRWMIAKGLWTLGRPGRKHRKKRERRAKFGELVQMDGSPHAWFEKRGKPCCLMVMIDDATSDVRAMFFPEETTEGAMRTLRGWIREFGIPRALYVDRKNTFVAVETVDGRRRPTAMGRICKRLGIEIIAANSPQAKGRVERSNRTFQDRLIKDMRYAKISDIESANKFLGPWMKRHSKAFGKTAADPADAHRSARGLDLGAILAWEEERTVNQDYTVRHENQWFQLEEGKAVPPPGRKVIVRRRLDGKLQILAGEAVLKFRALKAQPVKPPPPPRQARPRKSVRPAPDHPWRGRQPANQANAPESGALPPDPRSLPLKGPSEIKAPIKPARQKGPDKLPGPSTPSARPPPRRSGRSSAEPYPPDGPP